MPYLRCRCGKILAEVRDNPGLTPQPRVSGDVAGVGLGSGPKAIAIRCRHCKRYAILRVDHIVAVEFADDPEPQVSSLATGRPEPAIHPARGGEG